MPKESHQLLHMMTFRSVETDETLKSSNVNDESWSVLCNIYILQIASSSVLEMLYFKVWYNLKLMNLYTEEPMCYT